MSERITDRVNNKIKNTDWKEFTINNSLYILIFFAVVYIQIQKPGFLSFDSIINIISLSAANMPIALGIAGCIIIGGTDLSAGRIVGLTACMSASVLQAAGYANKMYPDLPVLPIIIVVLGVVLVGGTIGFFNGLFISKFSLHPFIVTLATQLMVYGSILLYLKIGTNNGQSISGLDDGYIEFIKGNLTIFGYELPVPNYVVYAIIITILMWLVWNKTIFGKNMFAVGSNSEAAHVSGVNVAKTTVMVFALAGMMYGLTGFIEGARIGSNSAITGANYELDAIAACVIGGVSFVGGIGKIRGVIMGVVLLKLIFVGLNFLSVDSNTQYIVKGLIILVACAIDMRKYLVKK